MLNDESHRAFLDTYNRNMIVLNNKVLIQYGTSSFSANGYYTSPAEDHVLSRYCKNNFQTRFRYGQDNTILLFVSHAFYNPDRIGGIYWDIEDEEVRAYEVSSIKERVASEPPYKKTLVPYYYQSLYKNMFMNIRVAACDNEGYILIRDTDNDPNYTYEASTQYCYLAIGRK